MIQIINTSILNTLKNQNKKELTADNTSKQQFTQYNFSQK